jgi:hypothetical protein
MNSKLFNSIRQNKIHSRIAGYAFGASALAFTTHSLLNNQKQATADNTKTQNLFAWGQGIKG